MLPNIGYGFFRPNIASTLGPAELPSSLGWAAFPSATLGMLGTGPLAKGVAYEAHRRFGTDVIYHHPAQLPDVEISARRQSFSDVMAARMICVVLPWPANFAQYVQEHKITPLNPDIVMVVWKRSLAMERTLIFLGKHYIQPVHLRHLAEIARVSESYLVRLFTATLGISPHRYQLLLRLSHAMTMLRQGHRITEIAQRVGFADHSHLDRAFRTLTGLTPSQYQRTWHDRSISS